MTGGLPWLPQLCTILQGGTGWCMVSVNCTQKLLNGKLRSRLACTICAVEATGYRESGTSLTIGAGSGTGRNKLFRSDIQVGNFGVPLKRSVYSGDFPVGQAKLALTFTV